MQLDSKVSTAIQEAVSHYYEDSISLIDGLVFSQYDTIKKVEFYSNSKYIQGQKDNLGRIKPFYNIVNFRVQIAVRATDLDISNINIEADAPEHSEKALLLNQELYNWMKETNFSKTLNDLGAIRPRYGGVLAKKVEKDGEVAVQPVQWRNIITDQTDPLEGIIIEKHYFSPSKLMQMDAWKNKKEALELATKSRTGENADVNDVSNIKQVEVWEVYMDVEEKGKYIPKQYMIATDGNAQVLLHEQEKEKPYKYLPWEYVVGRGLGRGQVEDGFESQMWTNDAVMAQKNAMDLAGKVVITSNSHELQGNALTDIDNGTIVPLQDNGFFNSTQLLPSALPELGNMMTQWDKQYSEVSSSFNSLSGEEMPSGTPFRSLALQSKQSASYFDYKREEFGIFIKEIMEDWILPSLSKKLSRPHTLVSQYDMGKLERLDEAFVAARLEDGIKKYVKKNKVPPTREQVEKEKNRLVEKISKTGNTRFIDIPKGYFNGLKTKVTVITTGEQDDKQAETDRLLGFADFFAQAQQSGDPAIVDIAKQISSKLALDIKFNTPSSQGATQASPSGVNSNPQSQGSAVTDSVESALPQAQQ